MRHFRRLVVVVAGVALATAAVASAKQSPPAAPPSLSGTSFAGSPTITSASCNPAGNSTFSYHVAGISFGVYSGTYDETGVVTVGPQVGATPSGDLLVSITASFTIDSVIGHVEGTKTLVPGPNALGICLDTLAGPIHFATATTLVYSATITTATGVFHDEGTSNLGSVGSTLPGGSGFSEGFVSSLLEPVAVKNGRGCGDENHLHARRGECP
jgi:hypothetical protein